MALPDVVSFDSKDGIQHGGAGAGGGKGRIITTHSRILKTEVCKTQQSPVQSRAVVLTVSLA